MVSPGDFSMASVPDILFTLSNLVKDAMVTWLINRNSINALLHKEANLFVTPMPLQIRCALDPFQNNHCE
jgi:hypothetical protein